MGANTLLLHPNVFEAGRPIPNRLRLLKKWVNDGGGLLMAGGYLSFQGFQAKANYAGTPVEELLPVNIDHWDDRVEEPQGVSGKVVKENCITEGLDKEWPILLGYQKVSAKPDSEVLVTVEDNPLLIIREYGKGRSAAFMSDISPHWAPQEFLEWNGYGELFSRIISWLKGDSK